MQNVGSDEDRTNWKMYPGSRDAILSKLKSQY
nr:MAG TPA: DNA repair protein REV1 [Bacteriophage sp.]